MSLLDQVELTPKQWALVIGAGAGIGLYLRHRSKTAATTEAGTDTIATDAPLTYTGGGAGAGYVSTVWGSGSGGSTAPTVTNPSTPDASAGGGSGAYVPPTPYVPPVSDYVPYTPPSVVTPGTPTPTPSKPVAAPDVIQPVAIDYAGRQSAITGGRTKMLRPDGYSNTYMIGPNGAAKLANPQNAQDLMRAGVLDGDPVHWTDGIIVVTPKDFAYYTGIDPASAGFVPM